MTIMNGMNYIRRRVAVSLSIPGVGLLLLLTPQAFAAETRLTTPDAGNLQVAVAAGGKVVLDFDGQVNLTNTLNILKDLRLEASPGRSVVLSGGGTTRIFRVSPVTVFHLSNMTVRDALGAQMPPELAERDSYGAGIFNEGGTLYLEKCSFFHNSCPPRKTASNPFGDQTTGAGGDIFNRGGFISIKDCVFKDSSVQSGPSGTYPSTASGGSIYTQSGVVRILGSRFEGCRATPGDKYVPGIFPGLRRNGLCQGGAISCQSGSLILDHVEFVDNSGTTEAGLPTLDGQGGALYNAGTATVIKCTFRRNGGAGLTRGAAIHNYGALTVINSYFLEHTLVRAVDPDPQYGGAIYSEMPNSAYLSGCTFISNTIVGSGFYGGPAFGGAIFARGNLTLVNCTFYQNRSVGGAGTGRPTPGIGYGGAVFVERGSLQAQSCTFLDNIAATGKDNGTNSLGYGSAIGIGLNATGDLTASIFADSNDKQELNVFYGLIRDLGFNICTDPGPELSAPSSLHNTDPKLGSIGFYGGIAPTLPLLSGSPAINLVPFSVGPAFDARGAARSGGVAADAGAFERVEDMLLLLDGPLGWTLSFTDSKGRATLLEESADLRAWTSLNATNAPMAGASYFQLDKTAERRFFRVR